MKTLTPDDLLNTPGLLQDFDPIGESRDRNMRSRLAAPIGSKPAYAIQDSLDYTTIGNPRGENHSAIFISGLVYEIHGSGMNITTAEWYFKKTHKTFYIYRYEGEFDPFSAYQMLVNVKNRYFYEGAKYDFLLLLKIWRAIRKNGLDNLKACLDDDLLICSEFVQIIIEAGANKSILNRLMLPNDKNFLFKTIARVKA